MTVGESIDRAFAELARSPGFTRRDNQEQLAHLISDCIEGAQTGLFEAPTGLGKSLACLIPAIAHAHASQKRIVIATYTNVLAEQYWRSDLPLALSLFEFENGIPNCQFLIGRQRYVCLASLAETLPSSFEIIRREALLGIESEFRTLVPRSARDLNQIWPTITAPPVCPARLCPLYDDCFYYKARRGSERASLIITNHSVVLQDAILRQVTDGEMSLFGNVDLVILDEAHDLPSAALNAFEFELSEGKLNVIGGIVSKLESTLTPIAAMANEGHEWTVACQSFLAKLQSAHRNIMALGLQIGESGILAASPAEVTAHPQVSSSAARRHLETAKTLSADIGSETLAFADQVNRNLTVWKDAQVEGRRVEEARDAIRNYGMYLRDFGESCLNLIPPPGSDEISVTYASMFDGGTKLRRDTIGIAKPLTAMLWSKFPSVSLSATLAIDGNFEHFKNLTGVEPVFEELLPSPFDFPSQAAIYLPERDKIPDPALSRQPALQAKYYQALASEVSEIIRTMHGRTLVLFHSRKEMEAVYELVDVPEHLEILLQRRSGFASTGERFKQNASASLFAVRSFWTGFDAPGETLSCVVLVRVPFEVPIDPPQVARMAWLQSQGISPFAGHALPNAKMMMRQGAGRLIRRTDDRGVIAILDPRIQSKTYGEEILANMPPGMRVFHEIEEAAAHVGLACHPA